MKAKWISCFGMVVAFMGAAPVATGWAKPGDLPVDVGHQCPEGRDGSGCEGFTPPRPEIPPSSVQPTTSPEVRIQVLPTPSNREFNIRSVSRQLPAPQGQATRDEIARIQFEFGEHYRRLGQEAQARVCYEEAHLASPTSVPGRRSIERLRELDQTRRDIGAGVTEEAETFTNRQFRRDPVQQRRQHHGQDAETTPRRQTAPSQDSDRRRMLESTVPLGESETLGSYIVR